MRRRWFAVSACSRAARGGRWTARCSRACSASVGRPAQLVVRIAAMLVIHSMVARAYTTALSQSATTALGIVFRLETMALFVGLGWAARPGAFVGQNLGGAEPGPRQAEQLYAALYNAVMMALLFVAYRVFGERIVRFFDTDPEVIRVGVDYLRSVGRVTWA
ncbi:MAG: MATE family efflux transporter [Polyangiaceae bacterium]